MRCILAVPEERVTGDARVNFDAYVGIGAPLIRATSEHQGEELERVLAGATIVVDALFGTGLARPIEGYLKHVIELVNQAPGRRVALDIPSGVDADSGAELGIAVRADDTVTFGAMKLGLLAPVGARWPGAFTSSTWGFRSELSITWGTAPRSFRPPRSRRGSPLGPPTLTSTARGAYSSSPDHEGSSAPP